MNSAEIFEQNGCVRVNELFDTPTISLISEYFQNKLKRGEWQPGDEGVRKSSALFYYSEPLIEILLLKAKDAIEAVTGRELLPTYSYSRVYQPGESLKPHTDRPACEISVTVNVASMGEPSPIYMQYQHNFPEQHILNPGDAIVYKGCEALHWREPLKDGQVNVQFMLHYVDKNGPNAEFVMDKRPDYGLPVTTRSDLCQLEPQK